MFFEKLRAQIRQAQARAILSVNRELMALYWRIGYEISERIRTQAWGAKVVERLASDLKSDFPDMKGLSARNLRYMRAFAEAYPDEEAVREALGRITWYHMTTLLDMAKDPMERQWYIEESVQHGWSRNVLVHQIEAGLYQRRGKALTNFAQTLPPPHSDLAQQLLKDPYTFDFLSLTEDAHERDLERGLLDHLRGFLLELGVGFAFVGNQYHLVVGERDSYLDVLFYHTWLHRYVVIDLKMGEFEPEYVGKMGFYLAAVDEQLRHGDDEGSIGLILCKTRNRLVAEYALRDQHAPMGIATYRLAQALPETLKLGLPDIEEIESRLTADAGLTIQEQDLTDTKE